MWQHRSWPTMAQIMVWCPTTPSHYLKQSLRWHHNGRDNVSNHQPHDCLLNHLFTRRSKKTSKLRVIGLCAGNSPEAGEFPAQMASNAENVSIWWRHHVLTTHQWVGNFAGTAEDIYPWYKFENNSFKTTTKSHRDLWVKKIPCKMLFSKLSQNDTKEQSLCLWKMMIPST